MPSTPSSFIARFHAVMGPADPDSTTRPMVVLTCATPEQYMTIGVHPEVVPALIAAVEGRPLRLPWRRGLRPAPQGAWDGCQPIWPTRYARVRAWWARRQGGLRETRFEGFTPTSGWTVRAYFQVGSRTVGIPIAASAGVFLTLTSGSILRVTADVLAAEGYPIGDDLQNWQR